MERGHHWLDRSTNQHGSQRHGGQAQMASCYAHRQPSWRTALDDDDDKTIRTNEHSKSNVDGGYGY